jgi:hypothetical protein
MVMLNEMDNISVKWLWDILSYSAFGRWAKRRKPKKTSDCIFVVPTDSQTRQFKLELFRSIK